MSTATIQTKRNFGATTQTEQQKKSKTTLFWEKYPNGIITVHDRRAVNK
jgi:hypothetical protein